MFLDKLSSQTDRQIVLGRFQELSKIIRDKEKRFCLREKKLVIREYWI